MKGPVIWVTGLSGAGKTTLSLAVRAQLEPRVGAVVLLDGDVVREALGSDLGYSEPDRIRNITRIQRLAKLLAEQNLAVIVAVMYSNPALLAWNRAHLPGYHEVYLKASVAAVAARDPKGLYAAYARGALTNLVGLDIPQIAPAHPDVVFDADTFGDVATMAAIVVDGVLPPAGAPRGARPGA